MKYRNYRLNHFNARNVACAVLINLFCNTGFCNTAILAKSLGVHGVVYPIEEQDPIALIQQRLKKMEENGELVQRNAELQKKARSSVERPKSVEGITKAIRPRTFYFDPSYEVMEDLYDHQGRLFVKKGLRINPLETISLSPNLLFFDGDDPEQLSWVKEQLIKATETKPLKLILVCGAPLKLAEELKLPVYFDQGGVLTKKLEIQHVPAVVVQENLHLKVEEVALPPSRELEGQGQP